MNPRLGTLHMDEIVALGQRVQGHPFGQQELEPEQAMVSYPPQIP